MGCQNGSRSRPPDTVVKAVVRLGAPDRDQASGVNTAHVAVEESGGLPALCAASPTGTLFRQKRLCEVAFSRAVAATDTAHPPLDVEPMMDKFVDRMTTYPT